MKYYIIAGEASGDLHGANLISALGNETNGANFRVWGGDQMKKQGATLVKHYKDLAFMGFLEVLKNIKTILANFKFCKQDILQFQPDALILIDYPGFNLRIAKWAKKQGIPVIYYISPQIWAWHTSRVHQIKANVDLMLVILPFEQDFYKSYDYDVTYVGHPLLDALDSPEERPPAAREKLIALLPGSRRQEIARMLPQMLEMPSRFPDYQFVIAGAPSIPPSFFQQYLIDQANVQVVYNQTYSLLQKASAALVTSGTATLETALFNVPQVVCYQGNKLSYHIAKKLVKVSYISLVNLILDRPLLSELIQSEFTGINLEASLRNILSEPERSKLLHGYVDLVRALGGPGASNRAAKAISSFLAG